MTDTPREPQTIKRRTVRVRPHSYQPGKAEMEEPVVLRNRDGSRPTVDEAVAAIFAPMEIVEDPDA